MGGDPGLRLGLVWERNFGPYTGASLALWGLRLRSGRGNSEAPDLRLREAADGRLYLPLKVGNPLAISIVAATINLRSDARSRSSLTSAPSA